MRVIGKEMSERPEGLLGVNKRDNGWQGFRDNQMKGGDSSTRA